MVSIYINDDDYVNDDNDDDVDVTTEWTHGHDSSHGFCVPLRRYTSNLKLPIVWVFRKKRYCDVLCVCMCLLVVYAGKAWSFNTELIHRLLGLVVQPASSVLGFSTPSTTNQSKGYRREETPEQDKERNREREHRKTKRARTGRRSESCAPWCCEWCWWWSQNCFAARFNSFGNWEMVLIGRHIRWLATF